MSSILNIRNKIRLWTVKAPVTELYIVLDCLELGFLFSFTIPTSWTLESVPFILSIRRTKHYAACFGLELNPNILFLQNFVGELLEQGAQDRAVRVTAKH